MGDYLLAKCDKQSVTSASMGKPREAIGIYKRGEWYWFTHQSKGVRQWVALETKDYAVAIERARVIRFRPMLSASGPFEQEIQRFIAYKKHKNEFTKASAVNRFYILRAFARAVDVPPAFVTTRQVQEFYDTFDNVETANGYLMILRSFFKWSVNVAHLRRHNPCDDVDAIATDFRGRRLKDFCSEAERDQLIRSCAREDLRFALLCGFHLGLRKNEIIEARPWWFDLKAGLLHMRQTPTIKFKDREERTIPLTAEFEDFLKTYGLREPFMLRPEVKHGANRYRYDFTRPFLEHAKNQGCETIGQTKLTIHLMRHTFASLLASNGVSLYKIAVWLGDDPRVVEETYARLRPKDPDIERSHHATPTSSGKTPLVDSPGNSPARSRSMQRSSSSRS